MDTATAFEADAGLVVALSLLMFVAFVAYAVTSFGENLIYLIGYLAIATVSDQLQEAGLTTAVLILTIAKLPMDWLQALLLRRHARRVWKFALTLGLVSGVCSIVGAQLLDAFGDASEVKALLGVLMVLIGCLQLYKGYQERRRGTSTPSSEPTEQHASAPAELPSGVDPADVEMASEHNATDARPLGRRSDDCKNDPPATPGSRTSAARKPETPSTVAAESLKTSAAPVPLDFVWGPRLAGFLVCCVASGVLGGLFSVSGPPMMVYVLAFNPPRDDWRALSACGLSLQLPVRAVLYFAVNDNYDPQYFTLFWTASLSAVVGLLVGNRIADRVDQATFANCVKALLLGGGVMIIATSV